MWALRYDRDTVVAVLLKHDAKVNLKNTVGLMLVAV